VLGGVVVELQEHVEVAGDLGDRLGPLRAEVSLECVRVDSPFRRGPLRNLGDVELITADYIGWFNQQRLMHRLGRVPPVEAEARYYAKHVTDQPAGSQNPEGA
jgi:putative transposase